MLELEHRFRVVDVHARLHAGPERDRIGREITADELEREMRQAGIVRSVVYPGTYAEDEGYLRANNAVARRSTDRPFVAFARVDGPRDPGTGAGSRLRNLTTGRAEHHTDPADVEQYAYDDRFHGFRLHPPRDGLPDEDVLDALASVGLPLLVHGGDGFTPAQAAATLLGRECPVILSHFGGYPADRELMADAVDRLDEHDDLYLDTSAVRYRDLLERAIREHPDRVLFGSGAPTVHPNVAVMEVLTLDVPEDAMARVFAKNAARVVDALA